MYADVAEDEGWRAGDAETRRRGDCECSIQTFSVRRTNCTVILSTIRQKGGTNGEIPGCSSARIRLRLLLFSLRIARYDRKHSRTFDCEHARQNDGKQYYAIVFDSFFSIDSTLVLCRSEEYSVYNSTVANEARTERVSASAVCVAPSTILRERLVLRSRCIEQCQENKSINCVSCVASGKKSARCLRANRN